jgi:hypothetical protein
LVVSNVSRSSSVISPRHANSRRTGVGDDDVEAFTGRSDLGIEPVKVLRYSYVTGYRDCSGPQLSGGGTEFGLSTAGDEHLFGALGDEALGGGQPDAGVGTGDDSDLVVE